MGRDRERLCGALCNLRATCLSGCQQSTDKCTFYYSDWKEEEETGRRDQLGSMSSSRWDPCSVDLFSWRIAVGKAGDGKAVTSPGDHVAWKTEWMNERKRGAELRAPVLWHFLHNNKKTCKSAFSIAQGKHCEHILQSSKIFVPSFLLPSYLRR